MSVICSARFDNITSEENIFIKSIDFESHFKYCLQICL